MDERLGAALGAGAYVCGSTVLLVGLLASVTAQIATAHAVGAGTTAGVIAAIAASRSARRSESIARPLVATALLALPVVGAVAAISVASRLDSRSAFLTGVFAALVAALGWLLLRRTAWTVRARRLVDEDAPIASLPPPADRTISPRLRRLNVLFAALLVVWTAAAAASGSDQWWQPLLFLAAPLSVFLDPLRGVAVRRPGVLLERRFGARCYEWTDFEGYYLDENRLVLLRPAWWRDDLSFDRGGVSDDAIAVVDEALPRAPAPVVPVGGFREPLAESSTERSLEH